MKKRGKGQRGKEKEKRDKKGKGKPWKKRTELRATFLIFYATACGSRKENRALHNRGMNHSGTGTSQNFR
jgi:hypothetical protein